MEAINQLIELKQLLFVTINRLEMEEMLLLMETTMSEELRFKSES